METIPRNLKSDHKGKIVSEDIRTAAQAVAKIRELGGIWKDVSEDEVKVYRLHFRSGNLPECQCPSPGVVLYVEKNELVAFVKAFSGMTERRAEVVEKQDVCFDSRMYRIGHYDENTTFRTYNGSWTWQNKKIVCAKTYSELRECERMIRDLKKNAAQTSIPLEKISYLEQRAEDLRRELFED